MGPNTQGPAWDTGPLSTVCPDQVAEAHLGGFPLVSALPALPVQGQHRDLYKEGAHHTGSLS